jgi:hypothetical protein
MKTIMKKKIVRTDTSPTAGERNQPFSPIRP